MSDPYPIFKVKPEWFESEEMGSKKKFWFFQKSTEHLTAPEEQGPDWLFKHPQQDTWQAKIAVAHVREQGNRPGEQGPNWLFKYPLENSGQHWAEKIAAEVAKLVGVPRAKVELAEFSGARGSVTKSFVGDDQELVHGNQLLKGVVYGYDPVKTFGQSSHTLSNIWQVIEAVFKEPEAAEQQKGRIAQYLMLDALIGNTDRHHENWGVLRKRMGESWRGGIAPSFDHASSLGRELPDIKRGNRLANNLVGDYAEKGRGAIYWSEDEIHGPSPLKLVQRATAHFPDLFRPALLKLERLDKNSISDLVNRVPGDWMTPLAREFAIALMCYNQKRLQELLQ